MAKLALRNAASAGFLGIALVLFGATQGKDSTDSSTPGDSGSDLPGHDAYGWLAPLDRQLPTGIFALEVRIGQGCFDAPPVAGTLTVTLTLEADPDDASGDTATGLDASSTLWLAGAIVAGPVETDPEHGPTASLELVDDDVWMRCDTSCHLYYEVETSWRAGPGFDGDWVAEIALQHAHAPSDCTYDVRWSFR